MRSTPKSEDDFDDEYDLGEPEYRPTASSGRRARGSKGIGGKEREKELGGKKVPWAFSIVEVDVSALLFTLSVLLGLTRFPCVTVIDSTLLEFYSSAVSFRAFLLSFSAHFKKLSMR